MAGCSKKTLPYQDLSHYSKVFGKEKIYRIYLPDEYQQTSGRYPVIYFFHGWGGRYFKDDNAKLEYEKLGALVNKYHVILVMWDGNIEESEPRPYNIGDPKDVKFNVQMKDYFPELIAHIDSAYRTYPDRNHRGIIGFSMGGFMSFFLAGKYPDKVSAAVNMVGSPEAFVGYPGNNTLFLNKYAFDNLRDVDLLFHNRTQCPMTGLNDEVNNGAIWSGLKNYEYHKLEGGHKIDEPGETKVFESAMKFIANRFIHPRPLQKQWSHYDLYPEFGLWGYSVSSSKDEPGYLCLTDVNAHGFGFNTRKWLPDGPPVGNYPTSITTAAVYKPMSLYEVLMLSVKDEKISKYEIQSDSVGRLHLQMDGGDCQTGIYNEDELAGFSAYGYHLSQNRKYLKVNQKEELSVRIVSRGTLPQRPEKLLLSLSCPDSSVHISPNVLEVRLSGNDHVTLTEPFKIFCNKLPPSDGSPAWLRVNAEMQYDTLHFSNALVLPVFYDVPEFTDVEVDDGRMIAVTHTQGDFYKTVVDSVYGVGNADGMASAGERIMLYENGHRLQLYDDDPYVIDKEERQITELLPAEWPDGYTLSSVVKISDDCPAGHEIEFLAHYETKTFMPMHREVTWGKVKICISPKPEN